jgi:hypothetical protein
MAHGLNASKDQQLHQALHGYADGHRQLALSMALKPRDQRLLLALSDISGPGVRIDEEGYLTGYPLPDSGVYALARTWPAPEMPRPGCVWTHTLLIDFADLASLEGLEGLLQLFDRPLGVESARDYDRPKQIRVSEPTAPLTTLPENWARQVLAALYGNPRNRVVAARPSHNANSAALSIWSQQWPRLRRNFRFCTLSVTDRSFENVSFDLQMLPGADRSARSRFAEVVDADTILLPDEAWLDEAVSDLLLLRHTSLRAFLRVLGADIPSGRDAFRPLCRLHRALERSYVDPRAIHDAVEIIREELATGKGSTAQALVVKAALPHVGRLDSDSFEFLWCNLALIDPDALAAYGEYIGRIAWKHEPARLAALQQEAGLSVMLRQTLSKLPLHELVSGLPHAPTLIPQALAHRPELISEPEFWATLVDVAPAFETAKLRNHESAAIAALVVAGRVDAVPSAVREFGSLQILDAAQIISRSEKELSPWLSAAVRDRCAVAQFLATRSSVSRSLLHQLARLLPPDAVPNDYGADPWLTGWRNASDVLDETNTTYVAAYLLSRALGSRSRSAADLVQVSLERVYWAAANDNVPDDAWRLLDDRLPGSIFWSPWDRCQRLRSGVANLFVDRELAPGVFAQLFHADELFLALVSEAARSSRGSRYIRLVHRVLKREHTNISAVRMRMIEELLD